MSKLKSERHHWWPVAVSEQWVDHEGCVHWLLPTGEVRRVRPKNLAVISNGHHIKLGRKPGEETPWDQSFEQVFQRADDSFPVVIDWLDGLAREGRLDAPLTGRFLAQDADDSMLSLLMEGLVSLAVRSPRNREAAVSLAEHYRGALPQAERNALIGVNIQHAQTAITRALGTRGKFAVIYSPHREFVFGDGFFHTFSSEVMAMHYPKIFVPLTPTMSVLFVRPLRYMTNPKLMTLVVSSDEAAALNAAVQVYASQALFYRTEAPVVIDAFRAAKHLRFASADNPIDRLIDAIPGVPPRDTSMDEIFALARRTQKGRD
jgi:hypothetical protein